MNDVGQADDAAERQAIADCSVLDHLVRTFPVKLPVHRGRLIRSAAAYHGIRRTWSIERQHEVLCTEAGARDRI